jgi:hypothetical protein
MQLNYAGDGHGAGNVCDSLDHARDRRTVSDRLSGDHYSHGFRGQREPASRPRAFGDYGERGLPIAAGQTGAGEAPPPEPQVPDLSD